MQLDQTYTYYMKHKKDPLTKYTGKFLVIRDG